MSSQKTEINPLVQLAAETFAVDIQTSQEIWDQTIQETKDRFESPESQISPADAYVMTQGHFSAMILAAQAEQKGEVIDFDEETNVHHIKERAVQQGLDELKAGLFALGYADFMRSGKRKAVESASDPIIVERPTGPNFH